MRGSSVEALVSLIRSRPALAIPGLGVLGVSLGGQCHLPHYKYPEVDCQVEDVPKLRHCRKHPLGQKQGSAADGYPAPLGWAAKGEDVPGTRCSPVHSPRVGRTALRRGASEILIPHSLEI